MASMSLRNSPNVAIPIVHAPLVEEPPVHGLNASREEPVPLRERPQPNRERPGVDFPVDKTVDRQCPGLIEPANCRALQRGARDVAIAPQMRALSNISCRIFFIYHHMLRYLARKVVVNH